ncbi:hypothetical protein H0H93_007382 [Arthromyces matolae]|nr:hypothetical protein H0H93_007382 [Arthromyces matolae]
MTLRGVRDVFRDEKGNSNIRHLLFSDIAEPNLVIEAVSGSVEELTVLVHSVVDDHRPSYIFDLMSMPNLKILEFPFAHITHVQDLLTRLVILTYTFPLQQIRITNIKSKKEINVWQAISAFDAVVTGAKMSRKLGSLEMVEFRFNRSHWDPPENMILESTHMLRAVGVDVRITYSYPPMPKPMKWPSSSSSSSSGGLTELERNQIEIRHPMKWWKRRAKNW